MLVMSYGIRAALGAFVLWAVLTPQARPADPRWIKARLGSFEAISDDGRKSATQALSQFEQFRFALGSAMDQPELTLDPPLLIIVFRNEHDMLAQCQPGLTMGRNRLMACTTSEGQLPKSLLRDLTHALIERNFSRMPAPMENALETFFSTVESNAVHVTWGAPPPQAERTREWALLHRVITQPDYSGKAKVYLHNLSTGMDTNMAGRNVFGQDLAKFDAEVDRYYTAGVFTTSAAPNRTLNPDRDFSTTFLTTDEGDLMRADLLTAASAPMYEALLKAGKHVAEANEGLAALALRNHDIAGARTYMESARKAGTTNVPALTTYAKLEDNPDRAIAILKQALSIDAKYAEAHWVFGEKLTDPARRLAEWKQAVNLAPRNYEWWAKYAQLCVDQQQYAEAGRAWVGAAQAAPSVQLREQYLTARSAIEQQRLEAEDQERHRATLAKEMEIDRLKRDAQRELEDFEAKVNSSPLSKEEAAKAVPWFDDSGSAKLSGVLTRVDCNGKQVRLTVKDDAGHAQTLLVPDTAQFEIDGGATLTCGAQQKARHVVVSYKSNAKGAGEATRLAFDH
jgi:hypothetical protein